MISDRDDRPGLGLVATAILPLLLEHRPDHIAQSKGIVDRIRGSGSYALFGLGYISWSQPSSSSRPSGVRHFHHVLGMMGRHHRGLPRPPPFRRSRLAPCR